MLNSLAFASLVFVYSPSKKLFERLNQNDRDADPEESTTNTISVAASRLIPDKVQTIMETQIKKDFRIKIYIVVV